jgi:hypothetical protein
MGTHRNTHRNTHWRPVSEAAGHRRGLEARTIVKRDLIYREKRPVT